jgi:hypothetical protein
MDTHISTRQDIKTAKTAERMTRSLDAILAWRKKYGEQLAGWDDVETIRKWREQR